MPASEFPQFEHNIRFLQFLRKVHDNPDVRQALDRRDFSEINAAPGLSEEERSLLKLFNWPSIEIKIDPAVEPFVAEESVICERRGGPLFVEQRCWKED